MRYLSRCQSHPRSGFVRRADWRATGSRDSRSTASLRLRRLSTMSPRSFREMRRTRKSRQSFVPLPGTPSHSFICDTTQVICPICGAGPIDEKALIAIQRATSPIKNARPAIASSSTKAVAPSSEIETIELVDSSDEEFAPPVPHPTNSKGKGKAKEVKAEDSDEDEEMVNGTGKSASMKGDFKSSTKLDSLVAYLTEARKEEPHLKAVVFRFGFTPRSFHRSEES